jgi:hypothetical protein
MPGSTRGVQDLREVRLNALQVPHGDLIILGRQRREDARITRVLRAPDHILKAFRDRLGHMIHWHVVHSFYAIGRGSSIHGNRRPARGTAGNRRQIRLD